MLILALARVGLASASLPLAADANFERALKALHPDILISDRDADAGAAGRQWLILNEAWFQHVSENGAPFDRPIAIRPNDTARIVLAGAADSTPQRISLSYQAIEISVLHLLMRDITARRDLENSYRVIPTLGTDTPAGFFVILAALMGGACVQIATAAQFGAVFSQPTPCVAIVSPFHAEYILSQLPPGMQPLPQLHLTLAGGNLPASLHARLKQSLTPNVQVVYGSDECGPVAFGNPDELGDDSAVGKVVPWVTLEVVDEAGQPVAAGIEGEVRLIGSGMVDHYDDDAALTARKFRDGWFYPGDRGILEPNGVLRLLGRSDDLVSLGGDKFDLRALDERVQSCPGLRKGAMFVAQGDTGMPVLWVALVTDPEFKIQALSVWLRERFPNLPEIRAVWIDRLPRLESGAPDRQGLVRAIGRL